MQAPPTAGATPYAPSGYQPGWATPTASAEPHRPLKGLSTALTVTLLLTTLAAIITALALLSRASLVDDFVSSRSSVSISDLSEKDDAVRGGSGFFYLVFFATGVLWIIWQFRHAKNAERLRGSLGLGPGWAIGGWFIPFGNFVIPGLQLHQAAKASDPDLPAGRPGTEGRSQPLVAVWAVLFGIAALTFGIASSMRPSNNDLFTGEKDFSDFAGADRTAAVGMFLYAAAAVVAIFLVRALTERQERAAATIAPSAPQSQVYMPTAQPQHPQAYPQPQQPAPAWGQPQPPQAAPPPPPPTAPPPPGQWGPPPTQ
jgi:hypothetical protein